MHCIEQTYILNSIHVIYNRYSIWYTTHIQYTNILAELAADGSDLLVEGGRVHHHLLLVGSGLYMCVGCVHGVWCMMYTRCVSCKNAL